MASSGRLRRLLSRQEFPYWTAALVTGVLASGYALLFAFAEKFSRMALSSHPYLFLALSPLCFLAGWWVVHRYAPAAGGSGMPQVIAAIELESSDREPRRVLRESLLGLKTILVKILGSAVTVLGGGSLGPEGPTIQVGAGVFHLLGRKSRAFSPHRHHEVWLVTGGAAGIAAAFNAPLGGIVFAIEELALPSLNKFKTSLIAAVIIAGLAAQAIMGSYLYLGRPSTLELNLGIIPWSIVIGAVCGLSGAVFGNLLLAVSMKRRAMKSLRALIVVPILCGAAISLSALLLEPNAMGPGREFLVQMLKGEQAHGDLGMVLSRFFAPLVTYASGCAGGIFAPSLAAGGVIGSFVAGLAHSALEKPFILLGMVGFLTGVTYSPFTAFILVLEMTDWQSLIFPMMLAALASSIVARAVNPTSFYHRMKDYYLPASQGAAAGHPEEP